MRLARPAISVFVAIGLALIGLRLAPTLAQAADITEIQAGLMTGAVITWAAFQIIAMLPDPDPANPTCSQPGSDETIDGVRWNQRAWVEGVVHNRSPLLGRLLALQGQGFTVVRGWPKRQIVLTEVDGRLLTAIGGWRMRRDAIHCTWRGIGRQALREVRQYGAVIHVIDPVWGRDDRLWPALMGAVR